MVKYAIRKKRWPRKYEALEKMAILSNDGLIMAYVYGEDLPDGRVKIRIERLRDKTGLDDNLYNGLGNLKLAEPGDIWIPESGQWAKDPKITGSLRTGDQQ